jgi:uncharacterized phosphosugar-binding protein
MVAAMRTDWLTAARAILDSIEETQLESIDRASELCARVIGGGQLVHLFGTGHSRIPLEEMFPRYGSYPGFSPIVELALTNYASVIGPNGLREAMFIERQSGLADEILASCSLRSGDAMIVFSFSGQNTVSAEVAAGARRLGLPVVVVTSAAAGDGPDNRLVEHGDVMIDLCTPAADALCEVGHPAPVGPGSTFAYVAVVNLIKVRTAELLAARGQLPPVITHRSVVGDAASKDSIAAAVEDQRRRLAMAAAESISPTDARRNAT